MKNLKTCIKGIHSMMGHSRGRAFLSVVLGILHIAASLSFVWICKELVDIATGVSGGSLGTHIIIMVSIMVSQLLLGTAGSWWQGYNVVKTNNSLKYELFSHVLHSKWNGKEEFHSGDVVNRLQADLGTIVELICIRIPDVVITIIQLIAASIYLLTMAPNLLWLLIGLMVIGVVGSRLFYKALRTLTERIRKAESEAQQHIQENLQNRVLVLTLIGTGRVLEKLGLIQRDIEGNIIKRLNYGAAGRMFMGFGFMAGYAAAFIWGVVGIKEGAVTYGMMTAFLQLVGQVQRPVADLAKHIPAFIHALTSEERLLELMELPLRDESEDKLLEGPQEISFSNVSFSYPGSSLKVLDNFSFTFRSGELTAITGPTGKGKSTMVRLAMGLLSPSEGSVSTFPMCNYMYVPQGNSLMSGTIRENLQLAKADAGEDEMKHALETAVADFVLDLPDGLDTVCGEVGSGLSEGQAQRIAIARALLHSGGILILDEATSALDSGTEAVLLDNISKEFRGKKTILFVSHREKVSETADSICRM